MVGQTTACGPQVADLCPVHFNTICNGAHLHHRLKCMKLSVG